MPGDVLMDPSKVFDFLDHELLIAKLHANVFGKKSSMLLLSYLSNHWQKTKINKSFIWFLEGLTLQGVPQGSVVGLFLFSIKLKLH